MQSTHASLRFPPTGSLTRFRNSQRPQHLPLSVCWPCDPVRAKQTERDKNVRGVESNAKRSGRPYRIWAGCPYPKCGISDVHGLATAHPEWARHGPSPSRARCTRRSRRRSCQPPGTVRGLAKSQSPRNARANRLGSPDGREPNNATASQRQSNTAPMTRPKDLVDHTW
jgi:hypothetical protein